MAGSDHVAGMPIAFIAGSSGLVGRNLLGQLLDAPEYARVVALGRREQPEAAHPKLQQVTVDFAAMDGVLSGQRCDDAFCCLGTTIRVAGSRENFRAVDHAAVLAFAWTARRLGARRFFFVSALGADADSRFFYNRVKGETEAALQVLGFETLAIFQPSLLLGTRRDPRLGERLSAAGLWLLEPLLLGRFRKFRAIRAETVARAMLRCSLGQGGRGLLVFPSNEIQDLGGFGP
jgi:uncharacterized protein YbjT (DUF2867 family)